MTDCPRADIRDLLPDWVNGSLEREAAGDVVEHLTTCASCSEEADLLSQLRAALSPEPVIDVRKVAETVVARTSSRGSRAGPRTPWRGMVGGLAVAASVILGALLIQGERDTAGGEQFQAHGAELPVAGGLADLEEDQLEALLVQLDAMEALPQTSTAPAIITTFAVQ
ncbi:MAG TPA: zf-HC2 domain-containing protein [Gemmatimonadaceae bacterium]|nr:zf-HC2 domain-containing protein [Gemmatimonadaceae bacterium]